ncbi:MAG TPA: hypothetical protein VK806_04575, partial [Bacteroidia bacterium]|nr:hypothetical protein [Bacteroidia bacterium]
IMNLEKAKELLDKSIKYIGKEVEIISLSAKDNKFDTSMYRIVDTFSYVWSAEDMEPTVDAWAKLETRDGKKIFVSLQKMLNNLEKAS